MEEPVTAESDDEPDSEPEVNKVEAFLPKPEKVRKKDKKTETVVSAEEGPAPKASPYGEWKNSEPSYVALNVLTIVKR